MEPLASRMRPKTLDEFVGQVDLVGQGSPLKKAIEEKVLFSFALWGPPGTGKTTLARIYAEALGADWHELSAVSAGKDDVRKIIQVAQANPKSTILFLDEIHRFNKAQQDFLLPYVESGTLTLIGATTENPSFEIIPALLSRMKVFVLHELSEEDLREILLSANLSIEDQAKDILVSLANGDARRLIGLVESLSDLHGSITKENVEEFIKHTPLRFDKKGDEHYNTISAFIKSMRASDADAALYYLARMIESGEDPKFIARRMVIFASEDVGMAQPTALVVANEVFRAVETIGLPEAGINLAHGVVYLAKAPKDKSSYYAYKEALSDAKKYGNLPIPMSVVNAPTKLMKNLGYGEGYTAYGDESRLPEKLKGKSYTEIGKKTHEQNISKSRGDPKRKTS